VQEAGYAVIVPLLALMLIPGVQVQRLDSAQVLDNMDPNALTALFFGLPGLSGASTKHLVCLRRHDIGFMYLLNSNYEETDCHTPYAKEDVKKLVEKVFVSSDKPDVNFVFAVTNLPEKKVLETVVVESAFDKVTDETYKKAFKVLMKVDLTRN